MSVYPSMINELGGRVAQDIGIAATYVTDMAVLVVILRSVCVLVLP